MATLEKKSVSDQSSFCPVVPRWNGDRIELHWYGWGGPIEDLDPLCDLTRAQAVQLMQHLESAIYKRKVILHSNNDAVKVVYKEEYNKGYVCNPHISLTGDRILFDHHPYDLVRKINDKEYLVKVPYNV